MQPLRQTPASGAGAAPSLSGFTPVVRQMRTMPRDRARYFYSGAAMFLLVVMFFGFQQFYLHGRAYPNRPLTPPIRTLLIAHGLAMSAWVLLLVVQPLLVVNGKRRLHMTLGKAGAVLAACVFILGLKVAIEATRAAPPTAIPWNLHVKNFMAIPITTVTMFAVFVAIGILNRRRPNIHRPMMLLATLAAMTAALSRIDVVRLLYDHTVWAIIFGPYFAPLVIGAILLVVKWALTRKFDRYYAIGWVGLVVAGAAVMRLATTAMWERIATALLHS